MRYYTHIVSGVLTSHLVCSIANIPIQNEIAIGLSALGSVLPDIDTAHSFISIKLDRSIESLIKSTFKSLPIIGVLIAGGLSLFYLLLKLVIYLIRSFIGHRGLTHSLLFTGILTILSVFIMELYAVPFILGYLSHIFADSLTPSGVPILYPYKKRYKIFGFITTGSLTENLIFMVLFVTNIFFFIK